MAELKKLRHAYLIIAHNNFDILQKLLSLLDSENADFYIHIDKKAKDFNPDAFLALPSKSKVNFTERTDVQWGGYSQINCEMLLIKAAAEKGYDYYHLLSGVDMPIKSCEYIEDFFARNNGKEFICFREKPSDSFRLRSRYMGHHFAYDSGFDAKHNKVVKLVDRAICLITPRKHYFPKEAYRFGSNWFSITGAFAEYVISQEEIIAKQFKDTCCCDEVFLHTICFNSAFKNNTYMGTDYTETNACLRYIDFERGRPYVFEEQDFDELMSTAEDVLFARKFDYYSHPGIVDAIYEALRPEKEQKK